MEYKIIKDSKKFYDGKQENYSKYRPSYANELFKLLEEKFEMKDKNIVELGAGTGKFSKTASSHCKSIYYVEPNTDMMNEGKKYCKECSNITYINKTAEDTGITKNSIDIVFAVQSFHWFDKAKLKEEVLRILNPSGYFAIVWNNCEDSNNAFSMEYFKYISYWNTKLTGKVYQHKNENDRKEFFKNGEYTKYSFIHSKRYSLEMLIGFAKSLSYAPKEYESYYYEFLDGIVDIFNKYSENGNVQFDFHTEMFIGRV